MLHLSTLFNQEAEMETKYNRMFNFIETVRSFSC